MEESQIDRVERMLGEILEKIQKMEELTVSVFSEVKPVLDELMSSPVGKMLGIGKKK